MPYIKQMQRLELDKLIFQLSSKMSEMGEDSRKGILNYVITKIALSVVGDDIRYSKINDVVGSLECCKMEFYRRLAAKYEDEKVKENGDVY